MLISRILSSRLLSSPKSVLLLGPRQTGKSTLLHTLQADLAINLAKESEFLRFSADVAQFESLILDPSKKTVFIDEIQRIPSLLNSIQAAIDERKMSHPVKFYLSGSSARKLKRGHANLLPGRIFTFQIGGLCARELGNAFDVDRALQWGTLPEPYLEKKEDVASKLLATYSATYLKEEIQAEALARDIQGFARFLNTMSEWSGKVLDFSKIASKAKVSRSSCVRFVEVLEDTLIGQRVSVFESDWEREKVDTIKHPKFYFFDPGVLNGLLNNFEASLDRVGNLFEHLVFSQLRNSAMALDREIDISFFRTRNGLEVDFIVEVDKKIWAIEVKSGEVSSPDLHGLKAFGDYYKKPHQAVVVGLKEKYSRKMGQILICDLVTLLKEMGL